MKLDPYIFNLVYPIVRVKIFRMGYETERESRIKFKSQHVPSRGEVKGRSKVSLARLAFLAANTNVTFTSMMTLTFPALSTNRGEEIKKTFRAFLTLSRRQFGDYSYIWFLEFQRRGTPHFHVLTTVKNTQQYKRDQFAKIWSELAAPLDVEYCDLATRKMFHVKQSEVFDVHRRREAWEQIRKQDGARRYMLKYALKKEQIKVPPGYEKVGRFWGHSYDVKPSPVTTIDVDHDEFIQGLLNEGNPCAKFPICPRYIISRRVDNGPAHV